MTLAGTVGSNLSSTRRSSILTGAAQRQSRSQLFKGSVQTLTKIHFSLLQTLR